MTRLGKSACDSAGYEFCVEFENKIKRYAAQTGMLSGCRRILAALSGGPDSVALLSVLCAWHKAGGDAFAIEAVHVNHGIRGEEADRDEAFCIALCEEAAVPLTVRRADVPALAKSCRLSLEEAARAARYEIFEQICRERPDITHVATAHHALDNAETVLLHLIRGSGGRGLSGIPPVRPLSEKSGISLIRPLLCADRPDILRYLEALSLPSVEDSSNSDCRFARNDLRRTIFPLLNKINPSVTQSLNRTAALAARDEDFLAAAADGFLSQNRDFSFVPAQAFAALHPAVRVRVLRSLFERAGGRGLSCGHLMDMEEAVLMASAPKTLSLPGGFCLYADADGFAVLPAGISPLHKAGGGGHSVRRPLSPGLQRFDAPPFSVYVYAGDAPDAGILEHLQNIYKLLINAAINFDKIDGNLYFRFRSGNNAEDRYRYGGHSHSVKDALSAHKVPQALRNSLPLFCDDSGILWIPGCRVRDSARPEPGCRTLTLCYACSPETEWEPRGRIGDCGGRG